MEISDKWCPSEVTTEADFFNISINDTDSVIVCTLSKFADDTKLCSMVNTTEGQGQDVIHRDLSRIKQ